MVIFASVMAITVPVIGLFLFAAGRQVVLRSGHPVWLHRRLAARRRPGGGVGAGTAAFDELQAFFNSNKRIQIEQRRVELILPDENHNGAPPRTGIDLDAGTAVIRPKA
jgi:hypothetical protein